MPSSADPKSVNWQQHRRAYVVSLLKARYGTYATPQTDFAYHLLPKLDEGKDYSFPQVIQKMTQQGIEGLFLWGMNPVVSAANARVVREALSKVKWMVAVDLWETETAAFWQAPGTDSRSVATEVFLLPAAASFEKEGSVTNSARLAQWRYKAVEPAGKAKPDLDIVTLLYEGLAEAYRREGGALPEAVTRLTWDYSGPKQEGISRPDPHRVAREYNGVAVADLVDSTGTLTAKAGSQLSSFAQLRGDGTTACGCWLYCGSYTEKGNMMARRSASDLQAWAFSRNGVGPGLLTAGFFITGPQSMPPENRAIPGGRSSGGTEPRGRETYRTADSRPGRTPLYHDTRRNRQALCA